MDEPHRVERVRVRRRRRPARRPGTMPGCSSWPVIRASSRKRDQTTSFPARSGRISFSATSRPKLASRASQTRPMPPVACSRVRVYRSVVVGLTLMAERTTCPARSGAIDIVFWIASSATCVSACRVGAVDGRGQRPGDVAAVLLELALEHPLDLGPVALGDQAAVDHDVGQRLGLAGRPGRARLGQLAVVDEVGLDRQRAEQEVAVGVHGWPPRGGDGTNCPREPALGPRDPAPGPGGFVSLSSQPCEAAIVMTGRARPFAWVARPSAAHHQSSIVATCPTADIILMPVVPSVKCQSA